MGDDGLSYSIRFSVPGVFQLSGLVGTCISQIAN